MSAPIVPSNQVPIAAQGGRVTTEWQRFFNALLGVGKPAGLAAVARAASPMSFTAAASGALIITGGTVSSISLTRGSVTIAVQSPVPVANGDVVKVTYTGTPTLTFVPS